LDQTFEHGPNILSNVAPVGCEFLFVLAMQNHYLVLSWPNALRRFICGVVKRDCQRNALGDRRCLVTQLSVGRFAKNNGNWV